MRSFSRWIIVLCASPAGVIVLAALDSTLFFSLPFGIDAALAFAYGPRILTWLDSNLFHEILVGCIAIAIALTVLSPLQVMRATGASSKRRTAAA
jgi:hypothetical protein